MTDPDPGFQGMKQGLDAAVGAPGGPGWVNQQVSSGQLKMNPEVAEAAAKTAEDYARQVQHLITNARQLEHVGGLGDYQISQGIQHHFEQKATQPGSGATDLLRQLQKEMLDQADAFRNAAKDYRSQEDEIAHNFRKGAQ
jgi:hypothetical protein